MIVWTLSSNDAVYISPNAFVSVNFLVNSLKYPKKSDLSLQDGSTETTQESTLTNLPQAYASDVLPVPEIPCNIISLPQASPAKNGLNISKS